MASAAFSNRLYRLDRSRLWFDEGLQTFLGSLRGIYTGGLPSSPSRVLSKGVWAGSWMTTQSVKTSR